MILAGDIGGTNTRMAVFEYDAQHPRVAVEEKYPSGKYNALHEIVAEFAQKHDCEITRASFGVAGPVVSGKAKTPNLPWEVDSSRLAQVLDLPRVGLINDLVANAYGIAWLGPDDVVVINEGDEGARGNAAVISPGTGLGEAGMYWDGRKHHPFASEGGHADYAPRDDLEMELADHLEDRFGRVSYERVLSGPGLLNIYQFLRDTGRGEEPDWLREEMEREDPSACISRAALAGKSPLCLQALDLLITICGAEAGNLALKMMAVGGVWLGGGIAPKIAPRLIGSGLFMRAFTSKGRLSHLVECIPVRIIMNDKTALMGAARHAAETDESAAV